ncbi:hypothetical protein GF369_02780 [Candidatus Peregrinibacteria bacterium]|nr:hypothetical protein [Candidatus Peregrinibacteria bacterium]
MHRYLFLLGRQSKLSVAELEAVVGKGTVMGEFYVIERKEKIADPIELQNMLGGTIKIAKVIAEETSLPAIQDRCVDYLNEHEEGKVIFAINMYHFAQSFKKELKNILKTVKRRLKKQGKGARFVNKPGQNVRSVTIHEEHLCQKGTDMTIVKDNQSYLLAYTLSVQQFKQYSFRDYKRPARDAKSGMLPPKLAQIMINIACKKALSVVYDPFCGSGTVLMEALLQGHQVLGSDVSTKAVEDTKQNLAWVKDKFMHVSNGVIKIFEHDATTLEKNDITIIPRTVVSEIYLGPPLSQSPSGAERKKNFDTIKEIFLGALQALHGILNNDAELVFAVPFYRGKNKKYFLDSLIEDTEKIGFKHVAFDNPDTKRGTLLYYRSDQLVGREILHFKMS